MAALAPSMVRAGAHPTQADRASYTHMPMLSAPIPSTKPSGAHQGRNRQRQPQSAGSAQTAQSATNTRKTTATHQRSSIGQAHNFGVDAAAQVRQEASPSHARRTTREYQPPPENDTPAQAPLAGKRRTFVMGAHQHDMVKTSSIWWWEQLSNGSWILHIWALRIGPIWFDTEIVIPDKELLRGWNDSGRMQAYCMLSWSSWPADRSSKFRRFVNDMCRPGTVFSIPFPEEGAESREERTSTCDADALYPGIIFVALCQSGNGCVALPITAYQRRRTRELGVQVQEQGIAFTGKGPPAHDLEAMFPRDFYPPQIRIRPRHSSEKLEDTVRIDFGQVFLIDPGYPARHFGDVDSGSMVCLKSTFREVWQRKTSATSRSTQGYNKDIGYRRNDRPGTATDSTRNLSGGTGRVDIRSVPSAQPKVANSSNGNPTASTTTTTTNYAASGSSAAAGRATAHGNPTVAATSGAIPVKQFREWYQKCTDRAKELGIPAPRKLNADEETYLATYAQARNDTFRRMSSRWQQELAGESKESSDEEDESSDEEQS